MKNTINIDVTNNHSNLIVENEADAVIVAFYNVVEPDAVVEIYKGDEFFVTMPCEYDEEQPVIARIELPIELFDGSEIHFRIVTTSTTYGFTHIVIDSEKDLSLLQYSRDLFGNKFDTGVSGDSVSVHTTPVPPVPTDHHYIIYNGRFIENDLGITEIILKCQMEEQFGEDTITMCNGYIETMQSSDGRWNNYGKYITVNNCTDLTKTLSMDMEISRVVPSDTTMNMAMLGNLIPVGENERTVYSGLVQDLGIGITLGSEAFIPCTPLHVTTCRIYNMWYDD